MAIWTLLFYRHVTGENDPEINRVIDEGAQWLLTTQTPEGGWPYGHTVDGKPSPGAPSGGSIWNIRALWRLGKETGNAKYLEAANRGKQWYLKTFVEPHHYHGYWEDVGPGSREGYDAALAALVFAEMGEKQATVDCARDAMQWVFTRQIECREATCSAGLVSEQTGWPPAAYCNPMMALAAYSAWQPSGDDSWRKFAMIPKATGWWYQPDTGAMVWIVDALADGAVGGPGLRELVERLVHRPIGYADAPLAGPRDEPAFGGQWHAGRRDAAGKGVGRGRSRLGASRRTSSDSAATRSSQLAGIAERQHGQDRLHELCRRRTRALRIELTHVAGASPSPKAVHVIRDGKLTSHDWDGKAR